MKRFPPEIIVMIARFCKTSTIANLCRCCQLMQYICEPVLYAEDAKHHDSSVVEYIIRAIESGEDEHYLLSSTQKATHAKADLRKTLDLELYAKRPLFSFDQSCIEVNWHEASLLHWAAAKDYRDIVEFLVHSRRDHPDEGIEISTGPMGYTPLFIALHFKRETIALSLLRQGAKTTHHGSDENALHLAAATSCLKVLSYLVKERGVLIDVRDAFGHTALHYALASAISSSDTISCLFTLGADINEAIFYGYRQHSPLDIACEFQRWAIASELIQLGAAVNGAASRGRVSLGSSRLDFLQRPLQTAMIDTKPDYGQEQAIVGLLSKMDLNEEVPLNFSPFVSWTGSLLHWVMWQGSTTNLALLLHFGQVDIEMLDSRGKTCIEYTLSISDWKPDKARLLLGQGAKVPPQSSRQISGVLRALGQVRDGRGAFQIFEKYPCILQVSKLLYDMRSCFDETPDETLTNLWRTYEWFTSN